MNNTDFIRQLREVLSSQVGMMSNLVDRIDGAAAKPDLSAKDAIAVEAPPIDDPIYVGMPFTHDGRSMVVAFVEDETILCQTKIKVISNGFEGVQLRDIRLNRDVVLADIQPKAEISIGAKFMDGDKEVTIQSIDDGKVHGTTSDGSAYVESVEVITALL